jgi:hypothetical protein
LSRDSIEFTNGVLIFQLIELRHSNTKSCKRVGGIDTDGSLQISKGMLEMSDMRQNQSMLMPRFIEIGLRRERLPVVCQGFPVRKTSRWTPQHDGAGEMRLGGMGIKRQCLLNRGEPLSSDCESCGLK